MVLDNDANGHVKKPIHVAVIGGGLVGSLSACFFAQNEYKVDLYEYREDIRSSVHVRGRSINLALSERGLTSLKAVGLADTIVKSAIPMYARMIHDRDGRRRSLPYGSKDQYIMSVDRKLLNEILLTEAEKHHHVNFFFEHKLVSAELKERKMTFKRPDGSIVKKEAGLIVGADGAFSAVRKEMLKQTRCNFVQNYIEHGYIELEMPATAEGNHAMEVNCLHIWPRDGFMMIALPNLNKTYTVTLFMDYNNFQDIDTDEKLISFFRDNFHDALPLIGKKRLIKDFFNSKPSFLLTVKCNPYHVGNSAVIIGDAAHAMVPFYGQGMNAGFEDCLVLNNFLTEYSSDMERALEEYSHYRNPDAEAICDLASYNYIEMRHLVNSPSFLLRKKLDRALHWLLPRTWIPLYSMVTFSRTRYHVCVQNKQWQDKVIRQAIVTSSGIALSAAVAAIAFFVKDV